MTELNPSQKKISDTLEGMLVVDAGPGTGKTHTIVERFINILRKEDVDPKDVLLLTFTKNAASEMEERVRAKMSATEISDSSKFIQTGTFDSFCFSVVMESPESISRFFRMEETLSRGASTVENETLNRRYFADLFDNFMLKHSDDYGDQSAISSRRVGDIYELINKLMSRGVFPLRKGWFGGNDGKILIGEPDVLYRMLIDKREDSTTSGINILSRSLTDSKKIDISEHSELSEIDRNAPIPEHLIEKASMEDRSDLMNLVHDVYYEYIRSSITDDRLTFGLVSMFAFVVLYTDSGARERMSSRYVIIDEFQDTNENQLMISLMLLKEPNLCVVGDWKQGIYGFRYADVGNILDFGNKVHRLVGILNDDIERIPFEIPEITILPLDVNYRSSQAIIDASFNSLYAEAVENDTLDKSALDRNIVRITAGREDIGTDTKVEFVRSLSREEEIHEVIRRIERYVKSGEYTIHDGDASRPPHYGDIAILCRNTSMCRRIFEAAAESGIPAYLQGDMEIMSTREGKLALAWLKYINNPKDDRGLNTILVDLGYPLNEIRSMKDDVPQEISELGKSLSRKRRRITDLLATVFSFYGMENDITQTIISVISSSHRNSLLTISDVISIIETDIEKKTTYPVDNALDRSAVTIQTMHKSKGLEYPVVILAGIDSGLMPARGRDNGKYSLDDICGLRCGEEVLRYGDDYRRISDSWKKILIDNIRTRNYDEERRIMFVAMSRAEQYLMLICNEPSKFFTHLVTGETQMGGRERVTNHFGTNSQTLIPRPQIGELPRRRMNVGVHDIMRSIDELRLDETTDEFSGKGKEYGTMIHELAHRLVLGAPVDESYPEVEVLKGVIESVSDADLILPEIECSLPFNDVGVTLRGIIDLLVVYPDRVVVHDYKTDSERRYEEEYKLQLSVYAHAASGFYRKPAQCIIDYVSRGESIDFEPLDISIIAERVRTYIDL